VADYSKVMGCNLNSSRGRGGRRNLEDAKYGEGGRRENGQSFCLGRETRFNATTETSPEKEGGHLTDLLYT